MFSFNVNSFNISNRFSICLRLASDPPENCHLTVKKLLKTWLKKKSKIFIFSKKNANGNFWRVSTRPDSFVNLLTPNHFLFCRCSAYNPGCYESSLSVSLFKNKPGGKDYGCILETLNSDKIRYKFICQYMAHHLVMNSLTSLLYKATLSVCTWIIRAYRLQFSRYGYLVNFIWSQILGRRSFRIFIYDRRLIN